MKSLPCGQCWARLSLASRLMIVAVLAVLLGGAALLHVTVRSMADSYHAELAEQLGDGLDSLTAVLSEQAVVGDYATIQQILDGRVKRKNVSLATWTDVGGKTLAARSESIPLQAPGWFVEWVNCPHFDGERHLELGGQSYGKIVMRLTSAPTMNHIWHVFAWQLRIILFGGILFLAFSALSLEYGLRPLYTLTQGAARFGQGDYSVRIAPGGAPEILPSIRAFNDMADKIEGLLVSQREREATLKESESNLRETVQILRFTQLTTGEGSWDWDLSANLVKHNAQWCWLLGLDEKKYLEHSLQEFAVLIHEADRDAVMERIRACLEGKEPYLSQHRMRRADGKFIWVLDRGEVMRRDGQGKPLRMVGSFMDVTERKQAEDEIRLLNETLEQRVTEEVAKNREKDHLLIHQSRLAAMGEMIGNIAHQWRQPLNALGLLLSNIQDAYAHHECDQDYLDESVAKGQRLIGKMSSTIDDFRNFFKPDREKVRFSLEGAVRDALSVVEASFISSGITVALDSEQGVSVVGFPNEYAQVVLNILGNAKDAILTRKVRNGRVEIAIGQDGAHAYVAIRDNGGGIAGEVMEKIFDPYFTTREKGTGIGLYMSKMIIENNMSGRIEVRNTGDGAEFRIATPLPRDGVGNG